MISDRRRAQLRGYLFLFVAAVVGGLTAEASPWPVRESDLPKDPSVLEQTLPNGLRVLVRPNSEPKGKVSVRLLVGAGSLHERDDEKGLAHFLEHMIFRGTVKHPGDSLAQMLQREGLGFGPDNTAFTHFDHTIYHLDLPRNDEASLRLALSVFFEYSNQAVIDAVALETERGVVLSEKAMRDTPDLRYSQSNFEFLWPASLVARRIVIGDEQVIQQAPRERLVAFYDAWYRPDHLAILIVGDIDPALAARCAEEIFGPMVPRGPARPDPSNFVPGAASPASVRVFVDPAMTGTSVHFQHPIRIGTPVDNRAERVRRLQRDLAFAAFARRLVQVAKERGDFFVSPSAGVTTFFREWEIASLAASSRITQWQDLVSITEQELRRALVHGFHESELTPVKRHFLESLDAEVRGANSRSNDQLIHQLVNHVLSGFPVSTPAQIKEEWTEAIVDATAADIHAAFKEAWGEGDPHVALFGNSALEAGVGDLSLVLDRSRAIALSPRPERPAPEFAYQTFGPEGKLVKDRIEEDLDVRLSEFANGVRFNFKATRFSEDLVQIVVRLPGGRLSLKENQGGLDWLASWSLIAGGLKRHAPTELADILAGRSVQVTFNVGSDAFYLNAQCSRRDLHLAMKILTAHLTDAGWRDEAVPAARASYGRMYSELLSTPGAPIRVFAERILFDDRRYGIPWEDEFYRHDLATAARWIDGKLKKGAIEVSIVGDTHWTEASSAVAKTLGALPKREAWPKKAPKPPKFSRPSPQPYAFQVDPKLKQSALAWIFPAPTIEDVAQERRARLLTAALEERLRVRLRQELGSAYAPQALFMKDSGLPGLSYFVLYAEVDAARTEEALAAIRAEFDLLREKGFTDDEFERSKSPFLSARAEDVRRNEYWLHSVLADVQQHPERLSAARSRALDSAAITRPEIESLLRQHLVRDQGYLFIAEPAPGHNWSEK